MTVVKARPAAETLAKWCADLRWEDVPEDARERARELVLDLIGLTIRGSTLDSSRAVHELVRAMQPDGRATVAGRGTSGETVATGSSWAALANATAAHATEMDDVTRESSLHPGVCVIPAAFALAEERSASGKAFLEAVVAGYEVLIHVGNALNAASAYRRGFHPTGVAGVFGAAVAAGRLLDLDADGLTRAIGIAGTMASGSLEYLADGSWTKRLTPGWAAHGGIVAAHLAAGGFRGPASALDGRLGLLRAYTDAPRPERLLDGLGGQLQLMSVSLKPHGCCRYSHGLIDAVLALRKKHGIRPSDVRRMRLGVLGAGWALIAEPIERKREPRNVVDAQFSAPYAAAVALARGAAGLREHSEMVLADPEVRSLLPLIDCYRDPALDREYPARWPAAVTIELADGRVVEYRVDHPLGDPENPVPRAALIERFASMLAETSTPDQARSIADRFLRIDEAPRVHMDLLTAPA